MLFNAFTTAALTACTLLAASCLANAIDALPPGQQSHLESRADRDIKVEFWDSQYCNNNASRLTKMYHAGYCIDKLDPANRGLLDTGRGTARDILRKF
ncbi:hypothetical protein FBEOM_5265 [Fusarium beomiforme]|uniref:Uncharacterized protein n=1 Tax=Fusarium beomiforme TaxID=44412 RepID=A0A9P5E052_9HYPO|nr:hypothetical protein FBEOM_5265 [Fusarium beomiforme]